MGIVLVIVAVVLGVAYFTGALAPFVAQLTSQVAGAGGNVIDFTKARGAQRTPQQTADRQQAIGALGGRG